jgi:hypothetical protein
MPVRAAAAQNRAKPPDYMLFNESDERVDITLPMPPASANDSLHALIKSGKKLCNEHHLKGKCSNGYNCLYSHEPKLSPGEVLALRHKARNMSCPQKTWCDECLCTNGHNCPNEVRHGSGKCTRGSDCYFADTHKMDRVCILPCKCSKFFFADVFVSVPPGKSTRMVKKNNSKHRNLSLGPIHLTNLKDRRDDMPRCKERIFNKSLSR